MTRIKPSEVRQAQRLGGAVAGSECGHFQPYPRELKVVPRRTCTECGAYLRFDSGRAMYVFEGEDE